MTGKENRKKQVDKEELVMLYEENNDALYRYAFRYLRDQDLAEECVSEVFTRYLHTLINGNEPKGNSRAYLYRIAHNWVVDYYRKNKPDENIRNEILVDHKSNPEMHFSKNQVRNQLRNALLKLPEEQRMVIELHILEAWSHEEVAQHLGKTVEASRALQYRGLRKLRKTIDSIGKRQNERKTI